MQSNNMFDLDKIDKIFEFIYKYNKKIEVIKYNDNKINIKSSENIKKIIQEFNNLRHLELKSCSMSLSDISIISIGINMNTSLCKLNLNSNNLGNKGVKKLIENITKNLTLKQLSLANNLISLDGFKSIADYIVQNSNLIYLDIGYNHINNDSIDVLAYTNFNMIKSLLMYSNRSNGSSSGYVNSKSNSKSKNSVNISELNNNEWISILVNTKSFIENNYIQELDLSNNNINNVIFIDFIQKYLKVSKVIKKVWLNKNDLNNDSCNINNTILSSKKLSCNTELVDLINTNNKSLEKLDLRGNKIITSEIVSELKNYNLSSSSSSLNNNFELIISDCSISSNYKCFSSVNFFYKLFDNSEKLKEDWFSCKDFKEIYLSKLRMKDK